MDPLDHSIEIQGIDQEVRQTVVGSGYWAVGVGVRVVLVGSSKSNLPISPNLLSLGEAADQGLLDGSLIIQTIGTTGKSVAAVLPLPDKLSSSSVTNALAATQKIRELISAPDTVVTPRIIGLHSISGSNALKPVDPFPASAK